MTSGDAWTATNALPRRSWPISPSCSRTASTGGPRMSSRCSRPRGPAYPWWSSSASAAARWSSSTADAVAQAQNPVTLDDDARIPQQVLGVDRAEVLLAPAEDHRYDVHRHLVHQAQRQRLPTDVAGAHRDHTVSGTLLRVLHGSGDVAEERHVGFGVPARRLRTVGHHDQAIPGTWRDAPRPPPRRSACRR